MYNFGMKIGNLTLTQPICLAPMAGVTDGPFRRLCRRYGADIVYTEFLSADGLVRGTFPQQKKLFFDNSERPIGFQLFGANSSSLAEAARMLCRAEPDLIDLNFGCPVKKVVRKNGGAAIMKNLDLLEEIVGRVAEAIDRPLTVKMRAGFSDVVFIDAAERAIRAGAQAVTLHARLGSKGYAVPARWEFIKQLKEAVDVPVIGNGDVVTAGDALRMEQETGCDGVMIGRGALGRPWVFKQIAEYRQTGDIPPEPSVDERFDVLKWHLAEELKLHGERRGLLKMRNNMVWYVRGLPHAGVLKTRLFDANDYDEVRQVLERYRAEHGDQTPPAVESVRDEKQPMSDTRGPW